MILAYAKRVHRCTLGDEIRRIEVTAENGLSSVDRMKKKDQGAALQQEGRGPQHMPIGEFGGAPAPPGQAGPILAAPMYWFYEMSHAALNPSRAFADAAKIYFKSPINPLSYTTFGKSVAAACELFERSTRRYGQPEWAIDATVVGGERVPVHVNAVWQRPFCRLLHFERIFERPPRRPQPRVLLVAPMSGHYPTLLRGTVEAFLPNHVVYIISILHVLRGEVHVIGVCQPSVPVLAAVARMEADADPYVPQSMVLMGGPIDTRANPTVVNRLAEQRGIDWFRRNVITKVPFPHPGFMRDVYPGFLQLNGFMTMNLDRHIEAHKDLFMHLVRADGDSAQKHREFYDEYLAVMDLAAEFYLQTVDSVFVRHALPKVEGENDDISGVGQTEAAQRLCVNLPADRKAHYLQPAVGHYGVFNGSRFRSEIAPRIADFMLSHDAIAVRRTWRKVAARA